MASLAIARSTFDTSTRILRWMVTMWRLLHFGPAPPQIITGAPERSRYRPMAAMDRKPGLTFGGEDRPSVSR